MFGSILVAFLKYLHFKVQYLRNGFDHEVHIFHSIFEYGEACHIAHRLIHGFLGHLLLGDLLGKAVFDLAHGPCQ